MKVCFAIPDMSLGGSSTVVHDIIKNWPNRDDRLFLVVFFDNFDSRYNDLKGMPNLEIAFLGKKHTIDIGFLIRLKRYIGNINPDVISSHLTTTFYLRIVGAQRIAPIYHTIHSEPAYDLPSIYRLFLMGNIKRGHIRLVGCCKYISRKAAELYHVNCSTITNGIDLSDSSGVQTPGHDSVNFLYVGRFDPVKNVPLLLESFELAKSENVHLTICGYGQQEQAVLSLIEKSRKNDRICFVGKIQNIAPLYAESDVLCLISEREGMPITMLEGIKYGLAFLVSDVGGITEFVNNGDNGFVLKNINPKEIANRMDFIAENKELLKRFKERSKGRAALVSARVMSEQYYIILRGSHL